jgi:endoglucanase
MAPKTKNMYSIKYSAAVIHSQIRIYFIAFMFFCFISPAFAVPGPLHVDGNKIKDSDGNVVVLRGASLPDLGYVENSDMNAAQIIDILTDETDTQGISPGWYTKIIRIPIFPPETAPESAPYRWDPANPDAFYNSYLRPVVNYCGTKGLYVIIDWHEAANTYDNVAETSAFWTYISQKFAGDTHVLFELFNEPNNQTDLWTSVRTDMQSWVDIVRNYAPNNMILVGTPQFCQVLAPIIDNPIDDNNTVYVAHIYPANWYGGNSEIDIGAIADCAAEYPVFVTEWGYMSTTNPALLMYNGTLTDYAIPLKAFLEQYGISNTACWASSDWDPPMFRSNRNPHNRSTAMGCFVKDWLYEKSGITESIEANAVKCTIKAGVTQFAAQGPDANDINKMKDSFTVSGTFASNPAILTSITNMDISIVSLNDEALIYSQSIDFNSSKVINDKFSYSHRIPAHTLGAITSLRMNFAYKTFSIATKNLDLTGLGCPLQLNMAFGNNVLSADINEALVNRAKLVPTRLMRLYKDKLIVNRAIARHKTTPASDYLTVTGDIAIANMDLDANEPNLVMQDVNITWSDSNGENSKLFTIPVGSFKAYKNKHYFTCSSVDSNLADANTDQVKAKFDLDKCKFTISINKASSIYAGPGGYAIFGINFAIPGQADFNEITDVNLVTRRSY